MIGYKKYEPNCPEEQWERWGFSVTVMRHNCPKCGAPAGYYCRMPSGRHYWPPHNERCSEITKEEIDKTRVRGYTLDEVLEERFGITKRNYHEAK